MRKADYQLLATILKTELAFCAQFPQDRDSIARAKQCRIIARQCAFKLAVDRDEFLSACNVTKHD